MRCAIFGCTNVDRGKHAAVGVRFHKFPKDKEMIDRWIAMCGQPKAFRWQTARVCSIHFDRDKDYTDIRARNKHVHEDAWPGASSASGQRIKRAAVPSKCLDGRMVLPPRDDRLDTTSSPTLCRNCNSTERKMLPCKHVVCKVCVETLASEDIDGDTPNSASGGIGGGLVCPVCKQEAKVRVLLVECREMYIMCILSSPRSVSRLDEVAPQETRTKGRHRRSAVHLVHNQLAGSVGLPRLCSIFMRTV